MAIATYRGERNLSEITNKLFVRLTDKQRVKAEAALLKANPQLADVKALPKGALLRVPDLPELRAKTVRSLENPDDQIAKQLAEALGDFDQRLAERGKLELESLTQQAALIKSARFRKHLSKAPGLAELANEAGKSVAERAQAIREQQKTTSTSIKQALKELQKFLV